MFGTEQNNRKEKTAFSIEQDGEGGLFSVDPLLEKALASSKREKALVGEPACFLFFKSLRGEGRDASTLNLSSASIFRHLHFPSFLREKSRFFALFLLTKSICCDIIENGLLWVRLSRNPNGHLAEASQTNVENHYERKHSIATARKMNDFV